MTRRLLTFCLCALSLLTVAAPAAAHQRSQSRSSWHIRDREVRMTFSVQALEVTRLAAAERGNVSLDDLLLAQLADDLSVAAAGQPCPPVGIPRALAARAGYVRAEWSFTCPQAGAIEITNDAFFDFAPSHVHYARIDGATGSPAEVLFTDRHRSRVLSLETEIDAAPQGEAIGSYLRLGIEHILFGIDHVAFLLALLLLCRRLREVVLMVTGFTIGHSLTLSLAALGVVEPDVPVIESLIGFTIALVAAENIGVASHSGARIALGAGATLIVLAAISLLTGNGLPAHTYLGLGLFSVCYLMLAKDRAQATHLRPVLTVLFGLIHGFGFASVLLEIGLPAKRLALALLGFNAGVEIGQLAIVFTLWLLAALALRLRPATDSRLGFDLASAGLCALGLYWFVVRAFVA
ncbi:MAG TPA: HupE/UreJ family protein [Candidatus Binatia bacterium]|nr:HupE/UreJ family protein [Candidatus Binatia bacterium]